MWEPLLRSIDLALAAAVVVVGAASLAALRITRRTSGEERRRRLRRVGVWAGAALGPIVLVSAAIRNPGSLLEWAVVVPLLAGGAVVLMWGLIGRRPRWRECPRCRYDMSATTGLMCPECGRTAKSERAMVRRRRRRWAVVAGALLALLGGGVWVGAKVRDGTWPRYVPRTAVLLSLPWLPDSAAMKFAPGALWRVDPEQVRSPALTRWERFAVSRSLAALDRPGSSGAREVAVNVITGMGARAAGPWPVSRLLALLSHAHPEVRANAATALAAIYSQEGSPDPAPVLAAMLALLDDPDPQVRWGALMCYRVIAESRGSPTAPPSGFLAVWRSEPDTGAGRAVRDVLLLALEMCEPDDVWWTIISEAAMHPDRSLRVRALRTMRGVPPDDERATAIVGAALEDPDRSVRAAAILYAARRRTMDPRLPEHFGALASDGAAGLAEARQVLRTLPFEDVPPGNVAALFARALDEPVVRMEIIDDVGWLNDAGVRAALLPRLRLLAADLEAAADAPEPDPSASVLRRRAADLRAIIARWAGAGDESGSGE